MKNHYLNTSNDVYWRAPPGARKCHVTELTRTLRFRDLAEPAGNVDGLAGGAGEEDPATCAHIEH